MQVRFIRMIDKRLENAPHSRKTMELKEEIVQNLMEKYNDLCAEGKSEEDAYNIAAESLGDLSGLVRDLRKEEPFYDETLDGAPEYTAGAEDAVDDTPPYTSGGSSAAYAPPTPDQARHRSAVITATAVMLFILSPVPLLFFGTRMGVLLLFALVAAGIGLLVYNSQTRTHFAQPDGETIHAQADATEDDEARDDEWKTAPIEERMSKGKKKEKGSIESALWLLVVAIYLLASFQWGGWHLTWVIFLFASAAENLLKIVIDPKPKKMLGRVSGALWTATVGFYFVLSFASGAWHITWIMFLIAAALNNVLRAFLNPKGGR